MDYMQLMELKEDISYLHYYARILTTDLERPALGNAVRTIADRFELLITERTRNGSNGISSSN